MLSDLARLRQTPSPPRAPPFPPGGAALRPRLPALTAADTDSLFHAHPHNLAVADATGLGGLFDGLDHLADLPVGHHHLDLNLRHEINHVGRPAIDLFLAAGAAKSLDLADGHALDPDLAQSVLHFVELERLDDG